jgi:sugar lactone lactonase YvrE
MFKCINNKGETVATYANQSEALTYWSASDGSGGVYFAANVRDGEITVFNEKQEEIGSITLPKSE